MPVSPEGWAVVAVTTVLAVGLWFLGKHDRWAVLLLVAVLIVVTFVKGTSPGGPRAREVFQSQRGNGDDQD